MKRQKLWLWATGVGFLVVLPLIAALSVAGVVAYWGMGLDRLGGNFIVLGDAPPIPNRRVYGLLAAAPPLILMLYALWRLFCMFLAFHRGRLVTRNTIEHLKAFSSFAALAVIAGFLLSGVMRWAMGVFDDAPLWTHLGFSTTHASVLFLAAIVYAASHIIEEGDVYRRETEEYV